MELSADLPVQIRTFYSEDPYAPGGRHIQVSVFMFEMVGWLGGGWMGCGRRQRAALALEIWGF